MVPDILLPLSKMTVVRILRSKSKMVSWLWKGNICIMCLESWCMTNTGLNFSKEPHTCRSTIRLNSMSKVPMSTEPSKAYRPTYLECLRNYLHLCCRLSRWIMQCLQWHSLNVILRTYRMTLLSKFMEELTQIFIWFLFIHRSHLSCLTVLHTNTEQILMTKETTLWSMSNKIVRTRSSGVNKI
jgi:hypothetical protein